MILEEKVNVIYSGKNIPLLKDKGYTDFKQGQIVEVKISDLPVKSNTKITAICDICKSKNIISFSKYNINFSRGGYYGCKKCSNIKLEKTSLEKYGTKRPSQSISVKIVQERTNKSKYGFKSALQNEEVKEKSIKKNLEKFGCEYPLSNTDVYNKRTKTMLERYGCEYSAQNLEIYKKINKIKRKIHEPSGLYYESSYELDFIEFCFSKQILISRGPTIKYEFDGKKRTYFSDFYLSDKNFILEVKSKYIYEKYIDKNLCKKEKCLSLGYNFLYLIDKDYEGLISLL
jgi:hypothetical protein